MQTATLALPSAPSAADRRWAASALDDGSRRAVVTPHEVERAEFARHDAEAEAGDEPPSVEDMQWWAEQRQNAHDEDAITADELAEWVEEREADGDWHEYARWAESLEAVGCVDAGLGDFDAHPGMGR
jgi:hypothetical protein